MKALDELVCAFRESGLVIGIQQPTYGEPENFLPTTGMLVGVKEGEGNPYHALASVLPPDRENTSVTVLYCPKVTHAPTNHPAVLKEFRVAGGVTTVVLAHKRKTFFYEFHMTHTPDEGMQYTPVKL
jgi:hypothetical protein